MSWLFILNGLISLVIVGSLLILYIRNHSQYRQRKITNWFAFIGFGYLVLSILFFSWTFKALDFFDLELSSLFSYLIVIEALVFIRMTYEITKDQNLIYISILFILSVFTSILLFHHVPGILTILSFLVILVISLYMYWEQGVVKQIGLYLSLYSILSGLFTILFITNLINSLILVTISQAALLAFFILIIMKFEKIPERLEEKTVKKDSHLSLYIKYFVFIFVITALTLISTVGVHEFSHYFSSELYGCTSNLVLFEKNDYPHTLVYCEDEKNIFPIALAGILIPIIIGLIIYILGGDFLKMISYFVIGFNTLASYKDFQLIELSYNFIIPMSLIGILFLILGVIQMAKIRIKQHMVIYFE